MPSIISAGTSLGTSLNLSGDTSGVLQLQTNGTTPALTIDTSQNVGIGTASPATRLDVNGTIRATDGGSRDMRFLINVDGGLIGPFSNDPLRIVTNGTERMRIDSSGNVGIGTSSPAQRLHVAGNQILQNTGSSIANNWIRWQNSSGTFQAGIASYFNVADTGNIEFLNGSTTNMMLSSSGNLGLGVTPSAWNAMQPAIEIGSYGSGIATWGTNRNLYALSNTYYTGTGGGFIYKTTGGAAYYNVSGETSSHKWYTAPSGTAGNAISFTQAMTLDASGRLLLGTTSDFGGATLQIAKANSTGLDGNIRVSNNVDTSMMLSTVAANVSGIYGSGAIAFGTGSNNFTERARINSSGEFSLGTTSSSFTANVGIKLIPDGRMGCVVNDATTGTNSYHLYNTNATNNGYRFYVNVNGGINNYSANNVNLSDRREKTDFAPAGEYLSKICAIPVQTYKYIDQSDNEKTLGVVAQDVQAVAPELVSEDNWGTEEEPKMRLSIYQTDLQYALMKCIQELKAELDTVKAELNTLKGQ